MASFLYLFKHIMLLWGKVQVVWFPSRSSSRLIYLHILSACFSVREPHGCTSGMPTLQFTNTGWRERLHILFYNLLPRIIWTLGAGLGWSAPPTWLLFFLYYTSKDLTKINSAGSRVVGSEETGGAIISGFWAVCGMFFIPFNYFKQHMHVYICSGRKWCRSECSCYFPSKSFDPKTIMRLTEALTHYQTIISQSKLSARTHTHAMCVAHESTLS